MTKGEEETDASASRTAPQVPPVVAANVRRLRVDRGYSIEQLAVAAAVAPASIERLEEGDQEPTIKTLWSVATALSVPFSALIATETTRSEARRDASPTSGTRSRKVLASHDRIGKSEVYELTLQPRGTETAAARDEGAQENVLVTRGEASIEVGGARYSLRTGDAVIFAADSERTYTNLGDSEATLYVVVSQPGSR